MFVLVDGKVRYEVDKPVFTSSIGTGEVNFNPKIVWKDYSLVKTIDFNLEEHYGCLCEYNSNIPLPQRSIYENHEVYTIHVINNHGGGGLYLCPKCEYEHEKKGYKLECACGVILLCTPKSLYMWD